MAKKISGKVFTLPVLRRIAGMPGHASSKFNHCVGGKLYTGGKGTSGKNRMEIRAAFTSAAKACA